MHDFKVKAICFPFYYSLWVMGEVRSRLFKKQTPIFENSTGIGWPKSEREKERDKKMDVMHFCRILQ